MANPDPDVVLFGDPPKGSGDSRHVSGTAAPLVKHALCNAVDDIQGDVRAVEGFGPR